MRRAVVVMCAAVAALAVPAAPLVTPTPATAAVTTSVPAATSTTTDSDDPLSVTIDQITPSTIPAHGKIHVSGTVTNNDTVPWSTIKVYPFLSESPMTTAAELAAAAQTDPNVEVGPRIVQDPYDDLIASLAPGQTASFSFNVPRKLLPSHTPGVYWFGVHALGQGPDGRDNVADGRARTFLPLVPKDFAGRLPTALVIPLRHEISYNDDGSLADVGGWLQTLDKGGRLRSLINFGDAAGDHVVDWLVDPALLDAVRQLAAGNPARSLAPTLEAGQNDGESDSSSTPSPSASGDSGGLVSRSAPRTSATVQTPLLQALDPVARRVAQVAQSWLDGFGAAVRSGDQVMALPYGDTDVSAAVREDPRLYQRARERSSVAQILPGVEASPAVGSPSGFLSTTGLAALDPSTTVLMTDQMFRDPPPTLAEVAGHQVVVTSSGAAAGGPGPDDPTATIAMRQRLLAEAAVRFLGKNPSPLVVELPHDWTPQSPSSYFDGLNASWLDLTTVDAAATTATARPVDPDALRYPDSQVSAELAPAVFESADKLIDAGNSLQSLLTLNNQVSGVVADEALAATSYSARVHPASSQVTTDRSRAWIDERLRSVHVSAPQSVTLSSSHGRFSTTITNDLDQPITVSLLAKSNSRLRVTGPQRVDVPAQGRQSVLLTARTGENGVQDVTIDVVDKRGVRLGATTTVSVRSVQVSNVIWLFLAIGAVLLFGTIGVRLFRRIRAARRTPTDPGGPVGETPTQPAKEPAGAGRR